jgi:hypothetical protein
MSKVDKILEVTRHIPELVTASAGSNYTFRVSAEDGALVIRAHNIWRECLPKEVVEQLLVYLNDNYGE